MLDLAIKRALISVTDKSGLVEFAGFLRERGVELVSTGGTYRVLAEAGLDPVQVSQVTGFPEIMGGRVKTLHPNIHAGILADKDNPDHLATLAGLKIVPFDCVCVNLYNFAAAASKGLDLKAAVEEIDIGGPAMLRASAKNYHSMLVIPEACFYPEIMEELGRNDFRAGLDLRRRLAARTFALTSGYDHMIADYLASGQE